MDVGGCGGFFFMVAAVAAAAAAVEGLPTGLGLAVATE